MNNANEKRRERLGLGSGGASGGESQLMMVDPQMRAEAMRISEIIYSRLRSQFQEHQRKTSFSHRKMVTVVTAIREYLPEQIREDGELSKADKVTLLGAVGNVSRVQRYMFDPEKLSAAIMILRAFSEDVQSFLDYIEYEDGH